MPYLPPRSLSILPLPNDAVIYANVYMSPCIKGKNFHFWYRFYIILLSFADKIYSCNWYQQKTQQATNVNAFRLPSGVLVKLRWTPKLCVNHNTDFLWTNHWCVNNIFLCFLWTIGCVNPVIVNWKNHQKVEHMEEKHYCLPLYFPVC